MAIYGKAMRDERRGGVEKVYWNDGMME